MSNYCRTAFAALAAFLLCAGQAEATTQWALDLAPSSGWNWDNPVFTFTNTSTAGETLTGLSITIGDTTFDFDAVGAADASEAIVGASLLSPDRTENNFWAPGGTSDLLSWSFSDFQAGETFSFSVDLDINFAFFGSFVDARWVMFNNDFPFNDPNTVVSATFSDGSIAALTLPDGSLAASYSFSSGPGGGGASVPEPAVFLLMGIGLVGLAWFGEPRRPSNP